MCVGDVDEADENGRTGLMYSAIADQLECLQLLLSRGAVASLKDSNGQTALHWAAATVSSQCPPYALGHGPSPLWHCLQGNHKSLKALIQLSQLSDLTMKDNDGRCALHLATSHANSKVGVPSL